MKKLRTDVLTRMVKFWKDQKDIKIVIAEKLSEFARREDLVGLVRPNNVDVGALAGEMARLSKENAALRIELSESRTGDSNISFDRMRKLLVAKEILDFLVSRRSHLGNGEMAASSQDHQQKCAELCVMGLVSFIRESFPPRYTLTERGREFLNRLESERLNVE